MTDDRVKDTGSSYIKNPDVVVHEEDAHGALLFNPDDDAIRVLNTTGFHIWKSCDGNRRLPELVHDLKNAFSDVPEGEVEAQVKGFLEEMLSSGFIGTLDE